MYGHCSVSTQHLRRRAHWICYLGINAFSLANQHPASSIQHPTTNLDLHEPRSYRAALCSKALITERARLISRLCHSYAQVKTPQALGSEKVHQCCLRKHISIAGECVQNDIFSIRNSKLRLFMKLIFQQRAKHVPEQTHSWLRTPNAQIFLIACTSYDTAHVQRKVGTGVCFGPRGEYF